MGLPPPMDAGLDGSLKVRHLSSSFEGLGSRPSTIAIDMFTTSVVVRMEHALTQWCRRGQSLCVSMIGQAHLHGSYCVRADWRS